MAQGCALWQEISEIAIKFCEYMRIFKNETGAGHYLLKSIVLFFLPKKLGLV